ncbi:hypothetical protein [Bacteroides sp. 14(A)]|uniref:hypothetical protein n=1 Tax=Bacteroides sp. 14(A) TaxID=1163670 RepID=UPI0004BB650D|nr:hypothetical protein [Bacteroides sp. 14(A)]
MSLQKAAWLSIQGFTAKYYLCETECGDFAVNRQAMTLYRKGMASTFATRFSSDRPKSICEDVEVRMVYKGLVLQKEVAQPKEKV